MRGTLVMMLFSKTLFCGAALGVGGDKITRLRLGPTKIIADMALSSCVS